MKLIKNNLLVGLTVIGITSLPAVAIATTTSTNFNVNASVQESFGLMCSDSTACTINDVSFGSAPATAYTSSDQALYLKATIGTDATTGNLYYKVTDSNSTAAGGASCGNGVGTNCFLMKGTENTGVTLPLQVSYQACTQTGYTVAAPDITSAALTVDPYASIALGADKACSAYTSGSGSATSTDPGSNIHQGVLKLVIPQQTSAPAADSYADTLTMTVCDSSACT